MNHTIRREPVEALEPRRLLTVVPARPAEEFVDSIGVNIHVHYTDTTYGRFTEWSNFLYDSGIRHVRDALIDTTWSGYATRLRALADNGVKSTLLAGSNVTPSNVVTVANRLGPDVIAAFEGQNEIINIYNGTNNATAGENARAFQQGLYNAVRGTAAYATTPVYAPTFVGGDTAANTLGDVSAWADYGNLHSYPYIRNSLPGFNLSGEGGSAEAVTRAKAQVVTETGFNTAEQSTGGKQPVTLAGHGKYVPRVLFEGFNAGQGRSFLYELLDQRDDVPNTNQEGQYGLIERSGETLIPKPGFTAIKNLNALLGEATWDATARQWRAPAFAPGSLDFDLRGDTSNVKTTLLQKSDGRFYLALWQDARSVNATENPVSDRAVAGKSISIRFNDPVTRVRSFNPLAGTSATTLTPSNGVVSLTVHDRVTLLEITPNVTRPQPVAAWTFDDVDNVGRSLDRVRGAGGPAMTFVNGAYKSGGTNAAHAGHALGLTTTGARAETPANVVDTAGSYTVAAWVRSDVTNTNATFLALDGTNTSGLRIQTTNGSGKFKVDLRRTDSTSSTSATLVSSAEFRAGEWHHVAATVDRAAGGGGRVTLYVDGVAQANMAFTQAFAPAGRLVVGSDKSGSNRVNQLRGFVDDVRIYTSSLPAAEIARLASGRLGRSGWTVTASHGTASAASAIDTSLRSQWSSGSNMTNGMWLQVDRGTAARPAVQRVELDGGRNHNNFAPTIRVEASNDGTTWSTVRTTNLAGSGQTIWFDAARNERFLRFVNTAAASQPWRVADLRMYGSAMPAATTNVVATRGDDLRGERLTAAAAGISSSAADASFFSPDLLVPFRLADDLI